MATLIPAHGACVSRMTAGEKRLADRLEHKLNDDYHLWYEEPVGGNRLHADFVVLHPRRGLLVLEVKEWRLGALQCADKLAWEISTDGTSQGAISPLEQARQYAHQLVRRLERDPQLVQEHGSNHGKLAFSWSYGVVLSNITRKQFSAAALYHDIEPNRVICQDELLDTVSSLDLQSRLWAMFAGTMRGALSPAQLHRVRKTMTPDVRLPSNLTVMDPQQMQLVHDLGDGHRVIHGVAGSGKTMILADRAAMLAKASSATAKPILVLCYNEPLAEKLVTMMQARGVAGKVQVRNFFKWCSDQLETYGIARPGAVSTQQYVQEIVASVLRGVASQQIPTGQYQAVLIDEGHDFDPEWLRLATHMVDPATNSLLVLFDDAQSPHARSRSQQFSFKSVGIQAQGRTTKLKVNYRNTWQILHTASLIAADLLTADEQDEDGMPLLGPISCGREGQAPIIIRLPNRRAEAARIAELLNDSHQEGHAWGDMAVICRHYDDMMECAQALSHLQLPHRVRKGPGSDSPNDDTIKVLTMQVSKGLEFPVVALVGAGQMPAAGEDERDEARLFYVGATRATQRLVIGASGGEGFGVKLGT